LKTKSCRDCIAEIPRNRLVCDQCVIRIRSTNGTRTAGRPSPLKGVPKSTQTRERMSAYATAHRDEMARRASGPKSPEWRLGAAERVRLGIAGFRTSKRGPFKDRKGRTFNMRSEWERLVAAYLDRRGYNWDYEPFSIPTADGSAYLPDFVLASGTIIEVKGYYPPEARAKTEAVRASGYRVVLFDGKALRRLGILTSAGSKSYREEFKSTTSRP
jgi:hypothetical protein